MVTPDRFLTADRMVTPDRMVTADRFRHQLYSLGVRDAARDCRHRRGRDLACTTTLAASRCYSKAPIFQIRCRIGRRTLGGSNLVAELVVVQAATGTRPAADHGDIR